MPKKIQLLAKKIFFLAKTCFCKFQKFKFDSPKNIKKVFFPIPSQLTLVFAWIQFCYVSLCMDSVPVCYPMEYRFGL